MNKIKKIKIILKIFFLFVFSTKNIQAEFFKDISNIIKYIKLILNIKKFDIREEIIKAGPGF